MSKPSRSQPPRPTRPAPATLAKLLARVEERLDPVEIWLFGSRARGDDTHHSDWDLLAVLSDDCPEELTDPLVAWEIARESEIPDASDCDARRARCHLGSSEHLRL